MQWSEMPSRIAIKRPFAESGTITPIQDAAGNDVNYPQGFPSVYSTPVSSGGKYVSRGEINAIGNVATNDLFYYKAGGINTFDSAFAAKIGGYPKDAVLQYLNGTYLYDVISLIDNNTFDFVANNSIDNVNWAYCNKEVASSDRVLLGQTQSITIYDNSSSSDTPAILIGVFRASKSGVLAIDVSGGVVYKGAYAGSTSSYISGIGVIAKDLGTSSTPVDPPILSNITAWNLLYANRLCYRQDSNGNGSPYVSNVVAMSATYGNYYEVAYFAGSSAHGGWYNTTTLSSVKVYIF